MDYISDELGGGVTIFKKGVDLQLLDMTSIDGILDLKHHTYLKRMNLKEGDLVILCQSKRTLRLFKPT